MSGDLPWINQAAIGKGATHVRVQVVSLSICAVAAVGCLIATTLPWPWFGYLGETDPTYPHYSAISPNLGATPFGSPGLAPGTQHWRYLIMACSALVVGLALVGAVGCIIGRKHHARVGSLLLMVCIASLALLGVVLAEFTATIPFGDGPALSFAWGAIVGLTLSVLAVVGASSAVATYRYPWLWDAMRAEEIDPRCTER